MPPDSSSEVEAFIRQASAEFPEAAGRAVLCFYDNLGNALLQMIAECPASASLTVAELLCSITDATLVHTTHEMHSPDTHSAAVVLVDGLIWGWQMHASPGPPHPTTSLRKRGVRQTKTGTEAECMHWLSGFEYHPDYKGFCHKSVPRALEGSSPKGV